MKYFDFLCKLALIGAILACCSCITDDGDQCASTYLTQDKKDRLDEMYIEIVINGAIKKTIPLTTSFSRSIQYWAGTDGYAYSDGEVVVRLRLGCKNRELNLDLLRACNFLVTYWAN